MPHAASALERDARRSVRWHFPPGQRADAFSRSEPGRGASDDSPPSDRRPLNLTRRFFKQAASRT